MLSTDWEFFYLASNLTLKIPLVKKTIYYIYADRNIRSFQKRKAYWCRSYYATIEETSVLNGKSIFQVLSLLEVF